MLQMYVFLSDYLTQRSGATAIEYSLIAAGISLALVAVVFIFGDELMVTYGLMGDAMAEANENFDP